jgi:alanine racemase
MIAISSPLRLCLDGAALVQNWRWLSAQSDGAACGAAIKADGYGLGARGVMDRLAGAGCRDFFVATWAEAAALMPLHPGTTLSVLHGVRDADMAAALTLPARPVLSSPHQIARWRAAGAGRPCDVMIDTGMNRLGVSIADVLAGALDGLIVETLMSHLASADAESDQNERQRAAFAALSGRTTARRMSLANSAGICLGAAYAFDLTRPGLALYGGIARRECAGNIAAVVQPQAQVLQVRDIAAGDSVGYNATFTAAKPMRLAIINLGYADGYLRAFSAPDGVAGGSAEGGTLPIIGRVSMDLIALDVTAAAHMSEGDWVGMDYDLAEASARSGLSPYELLTNLGQRYARIWA